MRPLTDTQRHQILALRGRPQRTIAKLVGCSRSAVGDVLREKRPRSQAKTTKSKPVSKPLTRDELLAAEDAGHANGDHVAVNAAIRALVRHDHPELFRWPHCFAECVSASPSFGKVVSGLTEPDDLAHLASLATDAGWWDRNDETDEEWAAFLASKRAEARARAVALLEAAIAVVRADT